MVMVAIVTVIMFTCCQCIQEARRLFESPEVIDPETIKVSSQLTVTLLIVS